VGSSAYNARNHDIGIAWRHDQHLLQLNVGQQNIPFEGFPNQRMDMTGNDSTQVNLRYSGKYGLGATAGAGLRPEHRPRHEHGAGRVLVRHAGHADEHPGQDRGRARQADVALIERDIARIGVERKPTPCMTGGRQWAV
jgi:iron complex outermembrane receptor protein